MGLPFPYDLSFKEKNKKYLGSTPQPGLSHIKSH